MSRLFDTYEATEMLARKTAEARFADVKCPACGAQAEANLIDASMIARPYFVAGQLRCSAECWRVDPKRYLDAVEALP